MSRVDPFATYIGAAGLVLGSIGLAFSGDSAAEQPFAAAQPLEIVEVFEVETPELTAAPVAFYAETLELIAPPVSRAPRAVSEQPARVTQAPAPRQSPVRIREQRPNTPAQVIVHRGKGSVLVYRVEREYPQ